MPSSSSPVYQPTTVSYEPRINSGENGVGLNFLGPVSSIDVNSPLRTMFQKSRVQLTLLIFALILLAAGIALLATGTSDWIDNQNYGKINFNNYPSIESNVTTTKMEPSHTETLSTSSGASLGILFGGLLLICLGLIGIGIYIKIADWRRNCSCPCLFFDNKQSLACQLQCQNGGGQDVMALNPSTDPLVSHTQYAPVSELPSLRSEDEERYNLMPENKDCVSSAEESDRMLEPDPRIVLRPIERATEA